MSASIPQTMRALYLTRSSATSAATLACTELPTPVPPAGHVLVKVHASGVQPSDRLIVAGVFPGITYPRVPGRDFAGTVVAGAAAHLGQAVFGTSGNTHALTVDGFHAEYAVVAESALVPKPAGLSWTQAARAGVPFTTAAMMMERAAPQAGETVVVLGAHGAVGAAVSVLARARGCTVLAAVRGPAGDLDTQADPQLAALMTRTDGRGADVIFDTVGQLALLTSAAARLAQGGRLVCVTAPPQGSTRFEVDVLDLFRQGKAVLGLNTSMQTVDQMAERLRGIMSVLESEHYGAVAEGEWTEVPLKDAASTVYGEKANTKAKYVIVMN